METGLTLAPLSSLDRFHHFLTLKVKELSLSQNKNTKTYYETTRDNQKIRKMTQRPRAQDTRQFSDEKIATADISRIQIITGQLQDKSHQTVVGQLTVW